MFLTNRVPDGVVDGKNPWMNRRSRCRGRNSRAGRPRRGWARRRGGGGPSPGGGGAVPWRQWLGRFLQEGPACRY